MWREKRKRLAGPSELRLSCLFGLERRLVVLLDRLDSRTDTPLQAPPSNLHTPVRALLLFIRLMHRSHSSPDTLPQARRPVTTLCKSSYNTPGAQACPSFGGSISRIFGRLLQPVHSFSFSHILQCARYSPGKDLHIDIHFHCDYTTPSRVRDCMLKICISTESSQVTRMW